LVYSTHEGRVRQPAERPAVAAGPPAKSPFPNDGVIRIFRERAGRGGKVVTVVRGLPLGAALSGLLTDLKRLCGAGGTVKGDAIELQGDHRERLAAHLRTQGYQVKLAGG
jgi:translation initiation factor 1